MYDFVIFIDPPDPDNAAACVYLLKKYYFKRFAIVIKGRVVDLSVPQYGKNFQVLLEAIGIQKMATPLDGEPSWIADVPTELQSLFGKDSDITDAETERDTLQILDLDVIRHRRLFHDYGCKNFDIFVDMTKLPQKPVLRHAFHCPNYKYDFDRLELKEYELAIKREDRRDALRSLCAKYIRRQKKHLKLGKDIFKDMKTLLKNQQNALATLFILGPFTDAQTYLKKIKVREIIAQGGSLRNKSHFMPNPFNFEADIPAAEEVLSLAAEVPEGISLIPTECSKAEPGGKSPFQFELPVWKSILGATSPLYNWIYQFCKDSGQREFYACHDLIAVAAGTDRIILPWIKATLNV